MAVEIPVIIDIDKAFEDAAARVSQAIRPLQSAIEGQGLYTQITIGNLESSNKDLAELNEYYRELEQADWAKVGDKLDLSPYINQAIMQLQGLENKLTEIQELRRLEGGRGDFSFAAEYKQINEEIVKVVSSINALQIAQNQLNSTIAGDGFQNHVRSLTETNMELLKMREYYRALETESSRMSDSINATKERISELNAEWNQMTRAERESERGDRVYQEYVKEVKVLREEALTLSQVYQKELERDRLRKQGAQKLRYENAILNATKVSMKVLQEQERILSDRLNRTRIGSNKYRQLKEDLDGVRAKLKEVGNEAERSNFKLADLIKNSLRLVALHAGTRFVRNVREVTAEFELQKVALGSIIQDTARAQSLFREIKAAAIQSPFQIKDLVSYTKQLSAYQIETDKLFSTTMKLADVSAGLGVDMGRLILAFGQVRAASVLRGQELRQFTEAGIPLVELLAKKFQELGREGTTTADVFELISKRAVPFSMIEEIFNDMTDAGGMFYKMQEKQAETLAGQWANLKDAVSIMYDEIGRTDAVHGAMTSLIKDARWLLQNWRKWAEIIKVAGSALLTYAAAAKAVALWDAIVVKAAKAAAAATTAREMSIKRLITSLIGKTAAEKISTLATNLYTAATTRAAAANTALGKTFWNLTAALAHNPFGLLAIAIGAVVAKLISLRNTVYDVEKAISDADASIKALRKNREETTKLIDSYEELSQKTSLSEKEQRKLKDTSRELAKAFPRATEAIDQNTGALILNIQKLRDYSAASQDVIEKGIRAQIKENEKAIKKNERKISRIEKVNKRGWGFAPGGLYVSGIFGDFSNEDAIMMSNNLVKLRDDTQNLKDTNEDLKNSLDGVYKTTEDAPAILDSFDEGVGRATDRLEGLKNEINDITNAYKKYIELLEYEKAEAAKADIGVLFPSLQGWEPSYENMVSRLEQLLQQYNGDIDATRLIEQAITNIKFDKIKTDLKNTLAKLKDDIKRSEEVKNFYRDIFDLTGDENIASNLSLSVYGDVGKDLGERLKDSILGTLQAYNYTEDDDIFKTLTKSAENLDFRDVMKNIDKVPAELRTAVKEAAAAAEKYNSDIAKSYAKLLLKFDEIEQQRVNITDQAAKDIETIEKGLELELKGIRENAAIADKEAAEKAARERAEAAKAGIISERDLGQKRLDREYRMFFNSVGVISNRAARKVARTQKEMITEQFNAGQKTLAQYKREIREIDEQLRKYENNRGILVTYLTGGTDAAIDKLSEFSDGLIAIADSAFNKKNGSWLIEEDEKEYIDKLGKIFGGKIFGVAGRKNILEQLIKMNEGDPKKIQEALEGAAEAIKEMGANMSRGIGWADFWVSLFGNAIKGLDELAEHSKNASGEVAEGWNDAANIFLKFGTFGLSKSSDAWDRLTALNEKAMSGFEKFKSGDFFGAIVDNIQGWMEVFGTSTKAIDRQIKEQSDFVDELKYQYDRLGVAIEEAFGSDYIYNFQKQQEILQAQAEAYRKQAELEREKGKKADEETAKGYEKSAREIEDQIKDMQGQLAEFFTGTDLTSAARDFAQAWIDAYKEFGSTTDAMKEKFDEMIENMVVNSLAAKLIQSILDPLFNQIDAAAKDGDLTAQEMGAIATQVPGLMDQINNSMGTLMGQLTTAGINLRQQAGQFTGISRDIAGASEESILGLAAGVNTANFYMSHLPAIAENVAALRAYIVGDAAATVRTTASEGPTYEDQMLGYAANLPMMRDDMYAIRSLLEKVIKPVGSAYYVSVR